MADKCACGVSHDQEPCKWAQINALAHQCVNNRTIKKPVVKVTKEMVTDILREIRQEYTKVEAGLEAKQPNPRMI
jgi:hypothetical protein